MPLCVLFQLLFALGAGRAVLVTDKQPKRWVHLVIVLLVEIISLVVRTSPHGIHPSLRALTHCAHIMRTVLPTFYPAAVV